MKIHLDLDSYFVSAERVRHPYLKGKNVVVAKGSDTRIFSHESKEGVLLSDSGAFNSLLEFKNNYSSDLTKAFREEFVDENGTIRGIVIAKSYEAKRYGIKTGTPLREALYMCKDLIVIPSDHLYYQQLSGKLKRYLEKKIPILEQYSIDEFFGDLGGWIEDKDVYEFISFLQEDILKRFDLPISIGASHSKWIAKLLTDKIKPYGIKVLCSQEEIDAMIDETPIEDFPGIGRAIQKNLSNYAVTTLKDAKQKKMLFYSYGKTGRDLYKKILGIDNEPVIPFRDRRGVGISRNFKAILDREELLRRVVILSRYLSHTIIKLNLQPTTYYFKIKYEGNIKSKKSITIDRLFSERLLTQIATDLFYELDYLKHYKIHFLAISVSNFTNAHHNQKTFSLLEFEVDKKASSLSNHLMRLRDKYGIDVVRSAREMEKN